MFLSRRTRLAPPPASCSAGSLTVSRKAKKSGPGSSRRKGPPPSQATRHRLGQHPGSQSHRIQGDCGRGRGLFPGRRVGDSSGFLGAQKWKVEEGLRNSAFCSRCCQGAGRRGGGPKAPRRAVWPVGCRREAHDRLPGHRVGPGGLRGWGEGSGDGRAGHDRLPPGSAQCVDSNPRAPPSGPPPARSLPCDPRQVSWPIGTPGLFL